MRSSYNSYKYDESSENTMRIIKKLGRFPFFGVLMGFLPILILWNANVSQMETHDIVPALLMTLGFVAFFTILAFIFIRNTVKAGLVLAAFFLFFFTFGHVYSLIEGKSLLGIQIGFLKMLVVYALLFLILTVLILINKHISSSVSIILNLILLFFCVANLASIGIFNLQKRKALAVVPQARPIITSTDSTNVEELPDIYYIVLDAYSRQDILQSQMGYDNSAFINALRQRGFYVADCANSNYDGTVASMAATLNYEYLDTDGSESNNLSLSTQLINNKIRADLKAYGYVFVTTKGFSSENDIPNSDIYLNYLDDASMQVKISQSRFSRLYFETTLIRAVIELYEQNPVRYLTIPKLNIPKLLVQADMEDKILGYATYWFNQTNYAFDSVKEFPLQEGNFFVYAHVNLPHGPYVYDADGNFRYVDNPDDNIPYYNDAVTYANKRTLDLVDSIITNSSTQPIIILQGDHGAHVITSGFDKNKILSAFYLPSEAQALLYPTITPVNTFRVILREVFDQDIDLLPDQVYGKETNNYEYRPSSCEMNP